MALTAFLAMVRKDLRLFFSDRRAVIISFVAADRHRVVLRLDLSATRRSTSRPRIDGRDRRPGRQRHLAKRSSRARKATRI